ncbi:MAG: hypothetical protein HOO88_07600 [Kiritimatiellaceae bacterium]|nr:hypothetical protein [Kiritimatiellaceae bacterium]
MEGILVIIGIGAVIALISWINSVVEKGRRYDTLKPRLDNLDRAEREFSIKTTQTEQKLAAWMKQTEQSFSDRTKQLDNREQGVLALSNQKAIGFPWLANAYADFFHLEEMKLARALETKKHPAFTAAEKVRESALRRREAERVARILKYQIEFYENLFPWLADLKSEDIEDEIIRIRVGSIEDPVDDDAARKWLTPEEYSRLPSREKYQTALDRYWTKKKSKWEIGRDYERYIGWRYESQGSVVYYQGIIEGFDDLGRDLIVSNGNRVQIVQCKYWSRGKTIHEKHIFQLYGTMIAYKMDHPEKDVLGHFITLTTLSERARQFANYLGIKVTESTALERYPCIKCNISRGNKEKIYHLPFDQQYDKTMVELGQGECFVSTIAEAEDKGFRRAFRYHGTK